MNLAIDSQVEENNKISIYEVCIRPKIQGYHSCSISQLRIMKLFDQITIDFIFD